MGQNRRIPGGLIKRHGATILRVLADATRALPPPPIADVRSTGIRSLLQAWMLRTARDLEIAPKLLAPEGLSRTIALGGAEALTGWRSAAMGQNLERLMRGEISLSIGPKGIVECLPKRLDGPSVPPARSKS
jgi:ribonuclease D